MPFSGCRSISRKILLFAVATVILKKVTPRRGKGKGMQADGGRWQNYIQRLPGDSEQSRARPIHKPKLQKVLVDMWCRPAEMAFRNNVTIPTITSFVHQFNMSVRQVDNCKMSLSPHQNQSTGSISGLFVYIIR